MAQLAAAGTGRAVGEGGPGRLLDLHLRELAPPVSLPARLGPANTAVIGVHTPGFSFEHDAGNVRGAVRDTGIDYPVGLDDEYAVWGAFASHYWPALYYADAQGRIDRGRGEASPARPVPSAPR